MNRVKLLRQKIRAKVLGSEKFRRARIMALKLAARLTPLAAGSIILIPEEDRNSVFVYLPKPKKASSYLVKLDTGDEISLRYPHSRFKWALHGRHIRDVNAATIYNCEARSGRVIESGQIEIVRQSEAALKQTYGFRRREGHIYIGRNTFQMKAMRLRRWPEIDHRVETLSYLTRTERQNLRTAFPSIARFEVPAYQTISQLIQALSELLRDLVSRLNPSGPSNLTQGVNSPTRILKLIETKNASLQCTGTRNLFVDLAVSLRTVGIDRIRKVDAFRYKPTLGIVVNGHSLLEVTIDGKNWLAFDPFTRMFFKTRDGHLLSAVDIRELRMRDALSEIKYQDIATAAEPYDPSSLRDHDPHNYNYWSHFNHLHISRLLVPELNTN